VKLVRALAITVAVVLGIPIAIATAPYACAPIYDFPPPRPFSGAQWYNPYDVPTGATWHVANFHAHSIAWNGLTNGHQPPGEVRAAYKKLGADVANISNYHTVDSTGLDSTFIGTYEYGYSIPKSHRLALGAREVNWLDFVFGATTSQKQWVLDRLRPTTALSVINHPVMRHGHTAADLAALGNYDLVEAMSSYGDSPAEWDAALSAGHATWAIGSDDNHDVTRADIFGRVWTVVLTPTTRSGPVLAALKHGSQVAVRGAAMRMDNDVQAVTMTGDTLAITLAAGAKRIRFVGDAGRELATVRDTNAARYVARAADTYVRIEVENAATTFWLNPVVRWDGVALPDPRPVVNAGSTWALRGALLLLLAGGAALVRRRRRTR
jgi:hypothetical protein